MAGSRGEPLFFQLRSGHAPPLLSVYIQRRAAEDFKKTLSEHKAAEETLQTKGIPTSNEGKEARQSMQTRLDAAKTALETILADIFGGTRVIQGGGNEVAGMLLSAKVQDAAEDSLVRMYPQFDMADDPRWGKVFDRAKKGDGSALDAVGYTGDIDKNAVCGEILNFITAGKKGSEIRKQFEDEPYGWPQDAIEGALLALLATGHIRASLNGKSLEATELERTKIRATDFRVEIATVSAKQRIAVRKLFQAADITCKSNDESNKATVFVKEMLSRAEAAGGGPPLPAKPATTELEDIGNLGGNEQIIALYDKQADLTKHAEEWEKTAELGKTRLPRWRSLQELIKHADGMQVVEEVTPQVEAIVQQRSLLNSTDPVPPLCKSVTDALRGELTKASQACTDIFEAEKKKLTGSDVWKKLDKDKRASIRANCDITSLPKVKVGTEDELLGSLQGRSISDWKTLADALPQRFANAMLAAAKELEPKSVKVTLPSATIKDTKEMEAWLGKARDEISTKLKDGPVVI